MDFSLTEEQELIRNNMREFAKKHVDPIAAEIDANSSHPRDLFRKLGEGGWMGIPIPPEYGGAGADFMTHVIAVEEISRFCSSTGFTLSFHAGIIGMSILLFGNEAQKEKYLVPLAMGRHLGSFAWTEPGSRHGRHGSRYYGLASRN
jgi:butyryl-CoA dehydrogenase